MIEKKIRIEKNEVEQEKLKIYFPHFDIRLNGISVMSVSCSSRLLFLTIMRIFLNSKVTCFLQSFSKKLAKCEFEIFSSIRQSINFSFPEKIVVNSLNKKLFGNGIFF